MLKPSELTPLTSELMADLVHDAFDEEEFSVIQGDHRARRASSPPCRSTICFTGSTAIGRKVAAEAAANSHR